MKNIGFAKIGKSIKFKTSNYSPIGGDNEASCVLRAVANHNPDKKFYILGKSDYSTLTTVEKTNLFPYDNVINIWENVKIKHDDSYYNYIIDYLEKNDISLDYSIMMVGQIGTVTIPNKIQQVKNRDLIASVIDMTKGYTTPLTTWLNACKPKILEIINDPRYKFDQSRDMFHLPTKSIGQYDFSYETKTIKSYEDQDLITQSVSSKYAGVETAFCMDYQYEDTINTDRKTNLLIVLNEGKPSRYDLLEHWILNKFRDVEVYGKWEHEKTMSDSRFRGSLHINEIQMKLRDVKYTFIIPIAPGWVTAKYIEMIHAGVIPFFHPSYDEQKHLDIPDFFRPATPEEFYKRIEILNSDEEKYKKSINLLRKKILKPEYYDGSFLNNTIMKNIDPNYIAPNLLNFDKKESSILSDFFN